MMVLRQHQCRGLDPMAHEERNHGQAETLLSHYRVACNTQHT
jgi:hypothetical protein